MFVKIIIIRIANKKTKWKLYFKKSTVSPLERSSLNEIFCKNEAVLSKASTHGILFLNNRLIFHDLSTEMKRTKRKTDKRKQSTVFFLNIVFTKKLLQIQSWMFSLFFQGVKILDFYLIIVLLPKEIKKRKICLKVHFLFYK